MASRVDVVSALYACVRSLGVEVSRQDHGPAPCMHIREQALSHREVIGETG